jgi:hypothetical protein
MTDTKAEIARVEKALAETKSPYLKRDYEKYLRKWTASPTLKLLRNHEGSLISLAALRISRHGDWYKPKRSD